MVAAGAAACAGLALAVVVVWTDSSAPHTLYQRSPYDTTGLTVSQRVSMAQAKVARDLAALRQTEAEASGKTTQKLGTFGEITKWGPRGNDQKDFERQKREGGLPLESPEHEFSHASPARNRAINERSGEFADELRSDTYHPPVHWGVGGLEGSGTMAAEDRGAANLESANVAHDQWPTDIYRGLPYPGFDRTQFNRDTHEDRYPHMDPLEQARETAESKQALTDAGVDVDRSPTDTAERTYNQVDGLNDQLVPVEDAPDWRKGGIAAQEEPSSFLLDEHPDLSGPQPTQDNEIGYELAPKPATKDQQAYWGFWDSIGCGSNGCFGARNGPEGEGA